MWNFINHAKTAGLLAVLTAVFLIAGQALGGVSGLLIAGILIVPMNFFAWFYSDKLAIKAMQAREIGPDTGFVAGVDAARAYRSVQRLVQNERMPMPRVYLCPHDAPNAFATGRSPRKAAVAVTRGLLNMLDDEELDGVVAHELAHIKHYDTLISTVSGTIAGVLAFVAQWFFFLGIGRREGIGGILVIILAAVGAAVLKSTISRTREFAADAEGARIAGSPRGLADALLKIDAAARRVPLVQPNPANNNLFIIEPLSGQRNPIFGLFASHPPTEDRINALRRLRLD